MTFNLSINAKLQNNMSNIDLKVQNWNQKKEITFDELVKAVKVTSGASQASALKAINRSLTMRNWLIGYYIVEFEQKGKERALFFRQAIQQIIKLVRQCRANCNYPIISRLKNTRQCRVNSFRVLLM